MHLLGPVAFAHDMSDLIVDVLHLQAHRVTAPRVEQVRIFRSPRKCLRVVIVALQLLL